MTQTDRNKKAQEFVKDLCRAYFVERDYASAKGMLHRDVIWVGTGTDKVYVGREATCAMFEEEGRYWKEKAEVSGEQFWVQQVSSDCVLVTGKLSVKEKRAKEIPLENNFHLSMLCIAEGEEYLLLHAHCSRPYNMAEENLSSQKYTPQARTQMEEMLEERSRRLKEKEEALRMSEKRYEVALSSSELTMFEYDIVTKDLIFFNNIGDMYQLPSVVPDGPETLIRRGTIEPASVSGYREMYRRIHAGEPKVSCFITSKDADGILYDFELTLTTVFDSKNRPVRAIGVRKNVSQILRLQKEQEFAKTLVAGRVFVCEADISNGEITDMNMDWAKRYGLDGSMTVAQLVEWGCANLISMDQSESIVQKLDSEYLKNMFEKGENLVLFSFMCKNENGQDIWHEGMINIIKDDRAGDLHARFYQKNIHERKMKEEHALEEQRMYESVIEKTLLACEVNITKNLMVRGHEERQWSYHIGQSGEYGQMVDILSKKGSHAEDIEVFKNTFYRGNVLKHFYDGKRRLFCQGRKLNEAGEYKWVCCTLNMYEDPDSGDVKGFLYLEDIDRKKKEELTLKFNAEHDLMTGLYNKVTTAGKINEFLQEEENRINTHAFLMIDVDNFKSINDNYGHAFGDTVLCDISDRLRSLFREGDIVGRIGGDEFCVFLKTVSSKESVCRKAEEICRKLYQDYFVEGRGCTISASVGIALYPSDGSSGDELYCSADNALYAAKEKGRNCYVADIAAAIKD